MTNTHGDWVAVTGNGTADTESAQGTIYVNPGAVLTGISVCSLTVGNTYAIRISFPNCPEPQKYVISSNGGAPTAGIKENFSQVIPIRVPVPAGVTAVLVSTFADVASATAKVSLKWEAPE